MIYVLDCERMLLYFAEFRRKYKNHPLKTDIFSASSRNILSKGEKRRETEKNGEGENLNYGSMKPQNHKTRTHSLWLCICGN